MLAPELIADFIAIVFYATIFVFAVIGSILYCSAYFRMKRTRIIGAVSVLMAAIAIDTFIWMCTEFTRFTKGDGVYEIWMVSPYALAIVKFILVIGVIHFVRASVQEDPVVIEACAHALRHEKQGGKKYANSKNRN
jgi:fatty acid desaturase